MALLTFKETKRNTTEKSEDKTSIASLENLLSSFKCLFKRRDEEMRHIVILLVSCRLVSKKSRVRETKHLSTDADSSTDTIQILT